MTNTTLLGLDLGGTHVKVALGSSEGELLWQHREATGASGGLDAVLSALTRAAQAGLDAAAENGWRVEAVGLGSPGVIDPATGRTLYPTANLPDWGGVDLHGILAAACQVPVAVDNDANVAVLAESRWGAARGRSQVLMATVGTGIGGGALVRGELLQGAWGAGMELGHVPYRDDGPSCGCGKYGCVEAYAGARGLAEAWASQQQDPKLELADLIAAAKDGRDAAIALFEQGARALAHGLVAGLYLLNPEVIVLGGGVLDGFPPYAQWIETAVRERALPKVTDRLEVIPARYGNQAGVLGAIALAADAVAAT